MPALIRDRRIQEELLREMERDKPREKEFWGRKGLLKVLNIAQVRKVETKNSQLVWKSKRAKGRLGEVTVWAVDQKKEASSSRHYILRGMAPLLRGKERKKSVFR
jgi:hypothetical protein